MTDLDKLGNNIRCLRIAYGETQEDLGWAIGVEKNTISYYEKGKREPDKEKLSAIAVHYMVSVEELLTSDFSNVGRVSVNSHLFWEHIEEILPVTYSEKASKNKHFRKAYSIHRSMFEQFKKENLDSIDEIDVCLKEYLDAYECEDSKCEAAANFVGLWLLFTMAIKVPPNLMKNKPAALMQLAKSDSKIGQMVEDTDPDFEKEAKEILADLMDSEMEELISELLTTVKQSEKWYPVADYFLALRYIFNLVSNNLEFEINRRIGAEMLNSFVMVENPYAKHYLSLQ